MQRDAQESEVDRLANLLADMAGRLAAVERLGHTHPVVSGLVDHGGLGGLADNDHPQYVLDAGDTMTGPLLLPDGSDAAPALAWSGDTNTGLRRVSADTLAVITNAVQRIVVDTVKVQMGLPIYLPDGSAAAPILTFTADTNTGLYRVSADVLALVAGGTVQATIGTADLILSQVLKLPDGSVSAPGLTFTGDANTGLCRPSADRIDLVAGGETVAFAVTGGGYADFNIAGNQPALYIKERGTATRCAIYFQSGAIRIFKEGVGDLITHDGTNPSFNRGTTSSTTTARWNGNALQAPTSTMRLKDRVSPLDGDLALEVLRQVQPVRFFWRPMKGDTDEIAALRQFDEQVGFIAEWMHEVDAPFGLSECAPAEGFPLTDGEPPPPLDALNDWEPVYWKEPHMIALLTAAVKELAAQVVTLQAEVTSLRSQA